MKFCQMCFIEIPSNDQYENLLYCDSCPSEKLKIKKSNVFAPPKDDLFKPENEGKTWTRVKSPYKAYSK